MNWRRSLERWFGVVLVGLLGLGPALPATASAGPNPHFSRQGATPQFSLPPGPGYVPGEVIVKFKDEAVKGKALAAAAADFAAAHRALGLETARMLPHGAVLYKTGTDVPPAVAALAADQRVEYAQPNFIYRLRAISDPLASWGITDAVYGVQAETAWGYTHGSPNVVVAVLDTGVDYKHPDLQGSMWHDPQTGAVGYDFINGDSDPMDDNGHGTHVAGIVAAALNGEGTAGVAPGSRVMAVKVLGADGAGTTAAIVEGINYAASRGAKVVNMSFGGYSYDQFVRDAIASHPDVLFVAAAGNGGADGRGDDNDTIPVYPASYGLPNIVTVAALADPGANPGSLASFSNYGVNSVALAAPGERINSAVPAPPADGGVALAVYDAVYGDKVMFWGFGAEDLDDPSAGASTTGAVYDSVVRTVYDFLGITPAETQTKPILLVDDDQSESGYFPDVSPRYRNALSTAGYSYALYTVPSGADGPAVDAAVYSGVIWFTGWSFLSNPKTANPYNPSSWLPNLTPADQTNLSHYLRAGGKLFLAGRDAGFMIKDTPFYRDHLGAQLVNEWDGLLKARGMAVPFTGASYPLVPSSAYIDVFRPASEKSQVVLTYEPYASWSGTSMAAPFVSGAAALLKSVYEVSPAGAIELLKQTVTPLAALSGRVASGGMLNAGALLQAAAVKPLVLTPTPADGATGVPLGTTVKVHANKRLTRLDTTRVTVYEGGTSLAGITPQLSADGFDVILSGLNLGYSRTYTVKLAAGAVTDFGGQANGDFSFSFTTGAAPVGGGTGGGGGGGSSGSGGGGGAGGTGGGGAVAAPSASPPPTAAPGKEQPPPGTAVVTATGEAQQEVLLDGKVTLTIPARAFPAGAEVTVKLAAETPAKPPAGAVAVSPVISIESAVAPKEPVTLALRFDAQKLGRLDPLACLVFREGDDGTWAPVGGKLDRSASMVKVVLDRFSNYAVFAVRKEFSDVPGHWAAKEVGVLAARGVLGGYPDGSFQPDKAVTRAELAALLAKFLDLKAEGVASTFSDVPPDAWYAPAVAAVKAKGLMVGAGGQFRPDATLTRQELAAVVLRLAGLKEQDLPLSFRDAQEVAPWAQRAVATAAAAGLMRGVGEERFAPEAEVTRAQVAVILYRLAERLGLYAEAVTVTGKLTWSAIEKPHWELIAGEEAYILLPDPADRLTAQFLRANEGKTVVVTGYPETGPSIFMRGPILRVVAVTAAQQ